MNNTKATLLSIAQKLDSVNVDQVKAIFDKYEKLPKEYKDLNSLRSAVENKFPFLYSRDIQTGVNKSISLSDQELVKREILDEHSKLVAGFTNIESIEKYIQKSLDKAEKIHSQIKEIFSNDDYEISSRVKEPDSILKNVEWGNEYTLVDIIGLRIVPKKSKLLPEAVKKFEEIFGDRLSFKINIFSYTDEEARKKISDSSVFYKAFHYHFRVDEFFSEVQIRTKSIDMWANINHDTLYKTKISLTDEEKDCVMDFGRISNVVDYSEMLS